MAGNNITVMVGGFISVAIMIGVTAIILGTSSFDCSNAISGGSNPNTTVIWEAACENANTAMRNSYNLIVVALIVFAAVVILLVVRSL